MNKVEIVGIDTRTLPKITQAELNALLSRAQKGDPDARNACIQSNLRLILSVIQKYMNNKGSYDDFFQMGCVGLIKAIDNFNPKFEVKFSTYAVPMILGEIKRFSRDSNGLRIPRSIRDTAFKTIKALSELSKTLNREPTAEEIAKHIGEPYEKVCEALNATGTTISLNEVVFDEGNKKISLIDQVSADEPNQDNLLEYDELYNSIKNLQEKEREILEMRYFNGKTQVEISEEIGISQAQVSRLEKNALASIKNRL
ncbi:MAG: sigma-70 family RNA polymerase sigma factor [Christensenellaceae bacterium]|jgi:RNA polymerase sporulation-specific sigma factor|nr:sigma-70 family RNA polymerase sigma factor [Christensenellaceae bacterium]